jgi:hypothetical protein
MTKLKDFTMKVKERGNITLPEPRDDEYQPVLVTTTLFGSL